MNAVDIEAGTGLLVGVKGFRVSGMDDQMGVPLKIDAIVWPNR